MESGKWFVPVKTEQRGQESRMAVAEQQRVRLTNSTAREETNIGGMEIQTRYKELKSRVEQACRTAEDFVKHYYEGLDRRRNVLSRLYLDSATLIWNGNGVAGKEFIQKFFEGLPTTDHVVSSIDSQPLISGAGTNFPLMLVICVSGFVAFSDEQPTAFQQQLLIMAEGDKWKIVSDCFRFQDP